MTMLAIPKNAGFEFKGLTGTVKFVDNSCAVLDFDERGPQMYQPHQLQDAYVEGEFKILQAKSAHMLKNITEPAVSQRYNFISATLNYMHDSGIPMSERIANEALAYAESKFGMLDGKTLSATTAKRWYTKWENNGHSVNFVLKKSKERRRSQFTRDCEALVDSVIQSQYLQFAGASVNETYKIFLEEYAKCLPEWERQNPNLALNTKEKNLLKPMSRAAFYTYVGKLDPYEVDKARMGLKAARKKHRCVQGSIIVNRPMERIEVDALHPNIALEVRMDDGTIQYERPIVYVAIDVFTRLIVAYVIDYSEGKPGETANAVVELIKQICNPLKRGKHTGIEYPLGGKPESIVSDSGRAFTATTVQMMLQSQGIAHHITQKSSPWKKPFVERFFGTLKSQCMHKLPSYAGVRVRGQELDNTLEEMAQYSRDEFEALLERYMLGIYHNNEHNGLDKQAPIDFWESVKGGCPPQVFCDFSDIAKFRGQQLSRVISSPKGLQINGAFYNCPELQALGHKLQRRNGQKVDARKVTVLYSTSDIFEITVINPLEDELLCVQTITREISAGLSLAEYQANKAARKNKRSGNSVGSTMPRQPAKAKAKRAAKNQSDTPQAHDITAPLSKEAQDAIMSGGIGKHADNHAGKKSTVGTPPSAIPSPQTQVTRSPSARC